MDLRSLRAFVEVVRQGGFTRAARTVFATQSTVSKAVKQLEEEIGLPLLDRVGQRSTPTEAGAIVFRRAVRMLAERDDLIREVAELRGLKRGTLRLGLPPVGSNILFAPVFAAYRRRYPGIDIRLIEQGGKSLEDLVIAGELDLAAALLPVAEGFAHRDLRREPIDLLVAAGHPLAGRAEVTMAELADQPFILFGEGFSLNPIILDSCRAAGFQPIIATRSSQIDFIVELVASGLGIGFLPRLIARANDGVRRVAIADPAMVWHIAMIWRRDRYLSHAARAWIDLVGETTA
jgi:DNA-binding transcriptional LysR family regulator